MKVQKLTWLLLVAVAFFTACKSKGPEYSRYVPKTATYVVAMDVKSMMGKLQEDSLSIENMLDVLKGEKNDEEYTKALEMWKQFKDAGLDWENKVLVAIPKLDVSKGNVSFQVVAGLKDEAKLQAFIAKLPNAPKVQKEGDISLVNMGEVALGWNGKAVMLAGVEKSRAMGMISLDSLSSIAGAENATTLIKKYFDLKKDESIASIKEFGELMEQKADIAVYTGNSFADPAANPFMALMPKVKELLDGMYSTSIINFEDGKITIESNSYAGKKMAEILSKYTGPLVDESLLQRYPSKNINGLAAFSFKPALIPDFLKETGLDAIANLTISKAGISIEDVTKAFKGDFAVMFSDFTVKATNTTTEYGTFKSYDPTGSVLFAARIADQAAFNKLVSVAEAAGLMHREGNRLLPMYNGEVVENKVYAGIENDLLIVASDSALYQGYAAQKTSGALSAKAAAVVKDKGMAFYVDAESVLKGIPDDVFDSTSIHQKNILHHSKDVFKDLWFNSSNFDGKKITGKGEVNLAPGKNALPQLVRYLMFVADEMKLQQKEEEAMFDVKQLQLNGGSEGEE